MLPTSLMRVAFLTICLTLVHAAQSQYTVHYLHPTGFANSEILSSYNGQHVGSADARGILWPNISSSPLNLTAAGHSATVIFRTDGVRQVGQTAGPGGNIHAAIWSGSTNYIDLHPAGYIFSFAQDLDGNWQVGNVWPQFTVDNAALWNDSAASFVNLHPAGFTGSVATCLDGGFQYGFGHGPGTNNLRRALRWSGTAASWIDLNPSGYVGSSISSAHQGVQVGRADVTNGQSHAGYWVGTAASFVDIHPAGPSVSFATGVANGRQVGYTVAASIRHAALWHGSAATYLDLHLSLGPNYSESFAYSIDPVTNQIGGEAFNAVANRWEAVVWAMVEEAVSTTTVILVQGSHVSGGVSEIATSDDTYYRAKPVYNVPRTVAPLQILVEGTAPVSSTMTLEFNVEAAGDTPGGSQQVFLYNFQAGGYDLVDTRPIPTVDTTVKAVKVSGANDYIDPSSQKVRARIWFFPPTDASRSWSARIDRAAWTLTH